MNELDQHIRSKPYVRSFVEEEFRTKDHGQGDGEPEVMFSVKLPVTDMARLERIAAYLDHKKTPFASRLLRAAIDDAWYGLLAAAEIEGKRGEVAEYLQELHHLEDGSGTVGPMRGGV